MSHLHIPDGVLPLWLWAPGLVLALFALAGSVLRTRDAAPQGIAFRGALGGLMLVVMAVEVPLGPLEYHLTLAGPVGVLLGPAASFQVIFVVNSILALMGHGGLTVVGLNALVLGAGAALARPLYTALGRWLRPAAALAASTAAGQALSGALWMLLVSLALRLGSGAALPFEHGGGRATLLAAFALPLWIIGIVAESGVGFGLARFLERVRPDLLPQGAARQVGAAGGTR
jgi:cobalt/nickel transport system permease protein